MFLVTNKPAAPTTGILGSLGLSGYFEAVLTPDSRIPAFLNKAEMLAFLVEKHQLDIAASLMVGDTGDDCGAAESLGMAVVLLAHGYGDERLRDSARCSVVPDLSAILKWSVQYGAEA